MASNADNLQDRNISAVFDVLDANGDGAITEEDFALIGRQVCELVGIAEDSDVGRKLLASYQEWWTQLQRDFDSQSDGRVTAEEFASAYRGGRGDPRKYFEAQLGRTAAVVADIVDADHDGFVSQDEYLRLLSIATPDREAALAGFQDLDTDGDGRISVAEFQAGVRQLMLSSDPTDPGTSMLGQKK